MRQVEQVLVVGATGAHCDSDLLRELVHAALRRAQPVVTLGRADVAERALDDALAAGVVHSQALAHVILLLTNLRAQTRGCMHSVRVRSSE